MDVNLSILYVISSASTMAATADDKSFLFTLVNPSGNEPLKLSAKPKCGGIRCRNDLGPRFGTSDINDLCLWQLSPSISFTGGLNLGNGFSCPQGKDKNTFFTGRSPFNINELEVFKVSN